MSNSGEWRPQLEALSDEFTVIAWDAPGCGGSFDPPEDFGLAAFAECAVELVDQLGLERPHVAGLSFGAGLALELFRVRPDLPRSLVLASGYAGWAGSLGPEEAERRRGWAHAAGSRPADEVAAEFATTLFTDEVPREIVELELEVMRSARPAGIRAMANAFAEADLRDVLPRIDVPTLLIAGDADQRAPLPVAEEMHSRIPGSRLVVFPGAGHMVNLEEPARFNEEVRRFLTG